MALVFQHRREDRRGEKPRRPLIFSPWIVVFLTVRRQLNLVEIWQSLDKKGLKKSEAYPLLIW